MLETFSQKLEWLCRKIWILLLAFLLLLLELIPTFILQKSTSPVAQWTAGLSSIGIMVFMCWLAERKGLAIWDRKFLTWKGLGLVALTVLFTSLSTVLGHTIMDLQGIEATVNQIGIERALRTIPFWLGFVRIACQAAILEEIIVRGYLFKKFFEKYKILGIVVSGLLFAFLHGPTDLGSWIIYASPGFLLAYLYYKTDYLIYPIAVHFINNAWAVLAFYYFQ
ncbi:CPBP family intramembrane glutamic endopeptidase [Streptococcus suis]|uniref:CPBP family intramembrane glutamic endopeptidase n=1 Tax=Streptococcus suis TaxID=1307 RepID=UPI00209C0B9B|nr:CPBP family intramembrane glutamic endopeptidase [Streptococcus suis]MCO8219937.1 CPBP family intramembrane metalloprotease [Streptococcus suis]HEM3511429.1 CPBP family intramembrane metalloprotease [Streptococcus suis]HEM3525598.1 CPBP family intramembrane metalloprotease [Streptococcus suis]HEM6059660.1 CPBP family intramembrane metalloprotease [Streptococcus suis]HEM6533765.1 CPBP family intramembrane metalloprotease [Streptococcus suis]